MVYEKTRTTRNAVLTGVDRFYAKSGFMDEYDIEGVVLVLDGKATAFYSDPDDGYRSYGRAEIVDTPVSNCFPAQIVNVVETDLRDDEDDEYRTFEVTVFNPTTGAVIASAGTTWFDSWYPTGNYTYYPENLPINQK